MDFSFSIKKVLLALIPPLLTIFLAISTATVIRCASQPGITYFHPLDPCGSNNITSIVIGWSLLVTLFLVNYIILSWRRSAKYILLVIFNLLFILLG